jgi:hypothetical protein
MIISKQKELEYILTSINNDPVFLVGCSQCATLCHTGGEEEVKALIKQLEDNTINVTGWVILDPACHRNNSKRVLKKYSKEISLAKKILVLSCVMAYKPFPPYVKIRQSYRGWIPYF